MHVILINKQNKILIFYFLITAVIITLGIVYLYIKQTELENERKSITIQMVAPTYTESNKKIGKASFKISSPFGIKTVLINDKEIVKDSEELYSIDFFQQEGSNTFKVSITDSNDISAEFTYQKELDIKYYVPILKYHHISNELTTSLYLQPELFEQQMKYLYDNEYKSITFAQLNDYLLRDIELPPKAIVISFDDGYYDNYAIALPILQKYGFVGSFGIITGKVELENRSKRMFMKWSEIKYMADSGMEIVSHSANHKELDIISDEELTIELRDSKIALEEHLGKPVKTIIYPFGNVNESVVNKAKEYGYEAGRITIVEKYPSKESIFYLPAIGVYRDMRVNEFIVELEKY